MNGSVDEKKASAGEPRAGSAGEPWAGSAGDTGMGPAGDTHPASLDINRPQSAGEQRATSPVEARPARLNVAALRRAVPIRMWGGKGSGLPCDFCRVLVGPEDVEYEVEAQLDGATVMLRFHYRCHYAWTGGEEPLVAADRA